MQKAINTKFVALFALVAMAFAAAVPAYAYDELEIEIEIKDGKTIVEVEYEQDGEDVEREYEYNTTSIQEVYTLLAAELELSEEEIEDAAEVEEYEEDESDMEEAQEEIDEAITLIAEAADYIDTLKDEDKVEMLTGYLVTAEEYLADAQAAFDAEDYEEAENKAEMASDKIEDHILPDDQDEDKDTNKQWTKDKCETNPGIGIGVNEKCDDDYNKVERSDDKYKDYGTSTDRAELQAQIQELMQLLIQLLTLQLANQST